MFANNDLDAKNACDSLPTCTMFFSANVLGQMQFKSCPEGSVEKERTSSFASYELYIKEGNSNSAVIFDVFWKYWP